jgi:hypothetical protein
MVPLVFPNSVAFLALRVVFWACTGLVFLVVESFAVGALSFSSLGVVDVILAVVASCCRLFLVVVTSETKWISNYGGNLKFALFLKVQPYLVFFRGINQHSFC